MDDEKIEILKREIERLRNELEHIFPEHEDHLLQLQRRIKEKELELKDLQPAASIEKAHWWEKILKR